MRRIGQVGAEKKNGETTFCNLCELRTCEFCLFSVKKARDIAPENQPKKGKVKKSEKSARHNWPRESILWANLTLCPCIGYIGQSFSNHFPTPVQTHPRELFYVGGACVSWGKNIFWEETKWA